MDIEDLICDQMMPFFDVESDCLKMSGPPLVPKPNGAQDLGLILHELATNASKYGALSLPTGRVVVSWSVVLDSSAVPLFKIGWKEEDGPRSSRRPARDSVTP